MKAEVYETSAAPLSFGFLGPRLRSLTWCDEKLSVELPTGSPRPPLLRLELRGAMDYNEASPQASLEIRMPEAVSHTPHDGSMEVLLTGALGFNKDARLQFRFCVKPAYSSP